MAKHFPATLWSLRGPDKWSEIDDSYVSTADKSHVTFVLDKRAVEMESIPSHTMLTMSRSEARLLARRIQQMLESTK